MKIKLSFVLSACCLMGAAADDLVVDNHERLSVVATNGDVTAGSVFAAPNAEAIEKTDASHSSGLVSGIGCLEVRPKGTVLLFR